MNTDFVSFQIGAFPSLCSLCSDGLAKCMILILKIDSKDRSSKKGYLATKKQTLDLLVGCQFRMLLRTSAITTLSSLIIESLSE